MIIEKLQSKATLLKAAVASTYVLVYLPKYTFDSVTIVAWGGMQQIHTLIFLAIREV